MYFVDNGPVSLRRFSTLSTALTATPSCLATLCDDQRVQEPTAAPLELGVLSDLDAQRLGFGQVARQQELSDLLDFTQHFSVYAHVPPAPVNVTATLGKGALSKTIFESWTIST